MSLYDHGLPADAPVLDLTPVSQRRDVLGPDSSVVIINRGAETLVRKFDGLDYALPGGAHIRMPYGAALHFQRHSTVPGTRNIESGAEQFFIGILGVDDPAMCEPFTDEQCRQFGQRIEAIERQPDEGIAIAKVSGLVASGKIPVRGASNRKRVQFTEGATADGGTVSRRQVMRADDGLNDAQREIAETAAEAAQAEA